MKTSAMVVLLSASIFSYAQNGNGNGNNGNGNNGNGAGNQGDHPAVPSPAGQGQLRPHVWIHAFIGPNANQATSTVLTPVQMTTAYGINAVSGFGQGATVAIVDAYDSPNAASDLTTFSSNFGISCSTGGGTFTKVNQNGATSPLPKRNSGWETEINLDTQWVHAIVPCANIVLVEANSNNDSDLMTAVSTAAGLGSVVSMSWGGGEFSGQTSYDSFFVKTGVTFLASSGDTGGLIEWPSSSPNVIGVGGTNLTLNSNNTVASETAWNGSGGGCSTVEPAISAQSGFIPGTCTNRASPDVSMDGGGNSPVYVYISLQNGWYAVYGTSLAVQLWAGVTGLANGLRSSPLNGALAQLYSDAAGAPTSSLYLGNYRDITSGTAGSFSATAGWDFVTGLGSPLVNTLVPSYLANSSGTADFSISASGSQSVVQGKGANYTVNISALNGFTGAVTFTTSGLPSGAGASFSPSSISGSGSTTMSVTTAASTPAGTYTITVTGTSGSLVHSTFATLIVSAAPDFSLTASPSSSTVVQGNAAAYSASVSALNGFTGVVNFSITGLPTGANATFKPSSVTGSGSSSLSVTTSTTTPAGTYTLTITGTSGSLVHSKTVTLIVNAAAPSPNFSISASPASQTVTHGSNTSYNVTVTGLNGFSGKVSFGVSGLPGHTSSNFSPSSVTGSGSSTLTISTNRNTSAGTYNLTINATSGSLSHSASVTLIVQ